MRSPGELVLLDMSGDLLGPHDAENPVWEPVEIVSYEGLASNDVPVYTVRFKDGMHWEVYADELTDRPWPGYCQACKAPLTPPSATSCRACGADDIDD